MGCYECQTEVVGSPGATVWYRIVGKKAVVRLFCSGACKQAWLADGPQRVLRMLAQWEAADAGK